MKNIKLILASFFLIAFISCEEDERGTGYLDNSEAPTDIELQFRTTQDNTGLVTITPTAVGATQFEIRFGDGTGSTVSLEVGESVDNVYPEGTYTVGVTATSINGLITQAEQQLVVSFEAPQNLLVTIENDAVISKQVNLTATADFAMSYEVFFGEPGNAAPLNANIGESVSYTYQDAGTYTITVVAMGSAIETTSYVEEFVVTEILAPIVSAPTPPSRDDADVIGVFSETYTYDLENDFFPFWGQSNEGYAANEFDLDGDLMLQYTNLSFQGIQLNVPIDASAMEMLHVDVWTASDIDARISPISTGPNESAFDLDLQAQEWTSFDIPLSFFTDANPLVDLSDIIQFKFDGVPSGEGTIFVDNIYFYRESTDTSPFDDGLLTNGDFENGSDDSWIVGVADDNPAPVVTVDGNTYYSVNVTSANPSQPFLVNLSQKVEIVQGESYVLTFDAWSDVNRSIIAGIGLSGGDFSNNSVPVNITPTVSSYSLTLDADTFGAIDARVLFDNGGEIGVVNIDNVSLTLVTNNLLTNGDFENGSDSWIVGVADDNPAPVVTVDGNTYYSVNVTSANPSQPFLVNVSQKLEILQDETYTLTFDAWSDVDRSIIAGIGLSGGDFSNNSEPVNISSTVETYTLTLQAAGFGAPDARVLFDLNGENGEVNIDNVSLTLD